MNKTLSNYAKEKIIANLGLLHEKHHKVFKLMYSPKDANADIYNVVKSMSDDQLDWAMQQVAKSLVDLGLPDSKLNIADAYNFVKEHGKENVEFKISNDNAMSNVKWQDFDVSKINLQSIWYNADIELRLKK